MLVAAQGLEAGKLGGYIEVMPAVAVKVEPVSPAGLGRLWCGAGQGRPGPG